MDKATFGAGCFWGVEAAFQDLNGVLETAVGYSGGPTDSPNYQEVCTGTTGHAEVLQIQFDPERISYEQLLEVFWNCHDPTTPNRQGPDIGSQYRSAIFFHSPQQEELCFRPVSDWRPTANSIDPSLHRSKPPAPSGAEEYHQRYFEKNGLKSCHSPGTG